MCLHEPGGAKGVNGLSGEALNVGKLNCDPQLQMDYSKQGNGRYLNRRLIKCHLIFKQKHLYRHLKQILILLLNTEAQKPKKADPARACLHSKWSSWKSLQQDVQI